MESRWAETEREMLAELARVQDFWRANAWNAEGQYFMTLGCDNRPLASGRRSAVLTARVLWAASAAYNLDAQARYLETARLAYGDLIQHFYDSAFGGIYEALAADGSVLEESKVTYTQAYAVYALSEYYRACGDADALRMAEEIFARVERYAFDGVRGGYHTRADRAWHYVPDVFTMDAHLHLMEAYTNLLRVCDVPGLRNALSGIVCTLAGRFLRPNGALYKRLTLEFEPTDELADNYGDEGECVWMMTEAAKVIADPEIDAIADRAVRLMAENILLRGYDAAHGGVFGGREADGTVVPDKLWWQVSESCTAEFYAYRLTGNAAYADAAEKTWAFIRDCICDPAGEWHWKVRPDGTPIPAADPSHPLKCPYHSSRVTVMSVPVLRSL